MKTFKNIILITWGIHLLAVNSNLLSNLTTYFRVDSLAFQLLFSLSFALSYSLGTIYTLKRDGFVWLKILFVLLDGVGVGLWYNSTLQGDSYVWYVSSFYVVYTILIGLGVGINKKVKNSNSNKYLKTFAQGYALYIKWLYNKSKSENKLKIAKVYEDILDESDFNVDTNTEENFTDIKKELNKIFRKK